MPERVRVTAKSGDVVIIGEPRDGIDVEGATASAAEGGFDVRGGSDDCTVRVPSGTDVVVGTGSGDVTLRGLLGAVSVTTVSAKIVAEDVASIDARTVSGNVDIEESRGAVRLKTKSAKVHVGRAGGDVRIASISGRIQVDEARAGVAMKTVSGVIAVFVAGRDPVQLETVSGKVQVTVPEGVHPAVRHRSVSGKLRMKAGEGDDLTITTRSVSGSTTIEAR